MLFLGGLFNYTNSHEMSEAKNTKFLGGSSPNSVPSAAQEVDEYVLVKKCVLDSKVDSKESKETKEKQIKSVESTGLKMIPRMGGYARSYGLFRTKLISDFSITPSTSSTLQTSVALAPSTDTSFTDHFRYLFGEICIESAKMDLDFHQFCNLTGDAGQIPVMVWGYTPKSFATAQTYALISDYATGRPIPWSFAKPNVSYTVPAKWMKGSGWTNGEEGSSAGAYFGKWAPCDFAATSPFCRGYINIATQAAVGTTGSRTIIGRMTINVILRNKI